MSETEILSKILKPAILPKAECWQASANSNEKKGLKIIISIYKYKGKKVFKTQPSNAPQAMTVEGELKKRQFISTYGQEFSTGASKSLKSPNIFDYKRLEDMPCAVVLNSVAIMFIQNWLDLKDDIYYQDLVLQCLRSIHAIVNSSTGLVSESHKNYQWNDPSKNYSVHRIDQQASGILGVRSASANKPWQRPHTTEHIEKDIKAVMFTKEDLMKQKQALIKGSGIIGKWIVAPTNPHVSNYQDTYVTHFNKYQKNQPPDFKTSISVGRLCPNIPRPYSIK
ncbi:hypothetical protein SteCoe_29629 [Stentor coeruleus]|uniref:Uncharacterized protein n=1 Tax=Stentor coeruleus TaxID=5963 RepID=A0A1R2B5I2_9CILI|nr:hypothetical protein SteCoe_29629 [Stentor coeruleus]